MFDTREAPQKSLITNAAHHGDAKVLAKGSVPKIPEQPIEMGFAQILPNSVLFMPQVPINLHKSMFITYDELYKNIGKFQRGIRLAKAKSFLSKFSFFLKLLNRDLG